jgi:glycosyltransferase involved in cell wall biosynthesis
MAPPRIAIVQPVVPDYRVPLFAALFDHYGDDFAVFAGPSGGSGTIRMDPRAEPFVRLLKNRRILGDRFVWQSGHGTDLINAALVIAPGSLRVLSAQWLLTHRRLRGLPTLLWGHAQGANTWALPFRNWMFRRPEGFIAYTRSNGEKVRRIRGDDKVWVASNSCVWRSECHPLANPADPPANTLVVGRLVSDKKPLLLLEGFSRAAGRGDIPKRARLVFTGNGPLKEALATRATALGIADRVILTGHISDRPGLESLYADALLAAAPGTLGLSGIQAFSAGVPMLVSRTERHGPELEASDEGFNTVFFDTDSVESLAEGLAAFYRDAPAWLARRAEISSSIAEHYTYDGMIDAFKQAIDTFVTR